MITRIFGGPGTGKTAYLLREIENLSKSTPVENIAFITWSTSAIEEVRQRLQVSKNELKWFNTLHGVCLSLAMNEGNGFKQRAKKTFEKPNFVISWQIKFCKDFKIPFDPFAVGASELLGNQAFSLYSKAIGTWYPVKKDIMACVELVYKESLLCGDIIKKWIAFKDHHGIIDFNDILIEAYERELFPPTDYVLVDEAQDLSLLEYLIIERFIDASKDAFVAGDDDQAIHGWKGAKARYFLNLKADEDVVLPKSHRVPSKIFEFANQIIGLVLERKEKDIQPAKEGGSVKIFPGAYDIEGVANMAKNLAMLYPQKTVFLLFRTNQMVKVAESSLIRARFPFKSLKGQSIWERELLTAWNAVAKTRNKLPLTSVELMWIFEHMKPFFTDKEKEILIQSVEKGNIPIQFYQIADKIPFILDENKVDPVIFEAIKLANKPIDPAKVNLYVDTIHASKGREADVVLLVDAITKSIEWNIREREGYEDELRVFYVGATRAREALGIVQLVGFTPFIGGQK